MSSQGPTDPESPPLWMDILKQAIAQNAQVHMRSLADMQRNTDEVHAHLRMLTQQHVQASQIPDFQLVVRARELDSDFWGETVTRAIDVLKQHGEYHVAPERTDEPETTEPSH